MYKVYEIVFTPVSRDYPNHSIGNSFRLMASASDEATAWGIAKAAWLDRKIKSVIISPEGEPIGGH